MVFRRWRARSRRQHETAASGYGDLTVTPLPTETAARQAAQTGSPAEMNRLGTILKTKGRPDEAAEWFRKAADAGDTNAMANLAMHLMSQGRNAEAAAWFRRAGGPLGDALADRLSGDDDDAGGGSDRRR